MDVFLGGSAFYLVFEWVLSDSRTYKRTRTAAATDLCDFEGTRPTASTRFGFIRCRR